MMQSIKEIQIKIKGFFETDSKMKERFLTITMIFLVGISSFGIGRLSALDAKKEPVTIELNDNYREIKSKVPLTENNSLEDRAGTVLGAEVRSEEGLNKGGFVVASKNGTKYHFPWCSGAQRILEENKVYFKSIEEAKVAGLTPAGNCKGLE